MRKGIPGTLGLMLIVAACGGDGDGTTTAPDPPPTAVGMWFDPDQSGDMYYRITEQRMDGWFESTANNCFNFESADVIAVSDTQLILSDEGTESVYSVVVMPGSLVLESGTAVYTFEASDVDPATLNICIEAIAMGGVPFVPDPSAGT